MLAIEVHQVLRQVAEENPLAVVGRRSRIVEGTKVDRLQQRDKDGVEPVLFACDQTAGVLAVGSGRRLRGLRGAAEYQQGSSDCGEPPGRLYGSAVTNRPPPSLAFSPGNAATASARVG